MCNHAYNVLFIMLCAYYLFIILLAFGILDITCIAYIVHGFTLLFEIYITRYWEQDAFYYMVTELNSRMEKGKYEDAKG